MTVKSLHSCRLMSDLVRNPKVWFSIDTVHIIFPILFSDLPRFPSQQGPGLSVVSGPAPVIQRPDLGMPESITPSTGSLSRVSSHHSHANSSVTLQQRSAGSYRTSTSLRSTKTQRIRGASNNLRLRQLELRENHATVLS